MTASRVHPPVSLFICGLLVAGLALPRESRAADPDYAIEYNRDFSTEGFDNRALAPFGAGATSLLQQSEEGVEIAVPAGAETKSVGLTPRFVVRGDFEITLWYEIKAWDEPQKGSGVGPTLYVTTSGDPSAAAEIGHLHRPEGERMHTTFARAVVEGEQKKSARRFETETMQGQLRIRRTGSELDFEMREDWQDEPHRVLNSAEFSDGDIGLVRVGVKRSDTGARTEVRFKRLRIRADELPQLPSEERTSEPLYRPAYHPPPQTTNWTRLILLGGGIVAVLAVSGTLFWRRTR
ncbi:hypothetical protein Mal4_09770 [Maioricimonas rarisocia]|uniref:DUF1583 domain-containing protein n=1 Tax=Maioricimonas rarisocia TaxID=2528026 RepID=A0A517Z2L7_9PLAN|nr:DUF1583 domain-containing protein [Maioricimonas rarisocia]QDU36689.1 hypothetical protein Mal4_09770 [Maioricimonas rarisocia]